MADISQIKLPNGSSINIKDATARSDKMDKTNPTGTGTFSLKDGNGTTKVSLNSSTGDISCTSVNGVTPTEVAANPSGTATTDLTKLKVGNSIYSIPQGGSGSGGHTIVDSEGTDLTQRTNLQFKGAYSEDNTTNDTTEINVAREMTYAEFEQLSEDEKVGLINITDITPAPYNKFQPVIFSEDEREIGVWTDGKPLYEKTIPITVGSNSGWTTTAHNIANVDKIANCVGILDGYTSGLTAAGGIAFFANSENVGVYNEASGFYGKISYVTIRYTKTTDTPGSGQWTPQGVPTVHYSTDEQIAGTWIDGSTLYEKTIYINNIVRDTSWHNVAHNITNIDTVVSIDGMSSSGTEFFPITTIRTALLSDGIPSGITLGIDTTNIKYINTWLDDVVFYVTIRYTKSSS